MIGYRAQIKEDYFQWLSDTVSKNRFANEDTFSNLLRQLHDREFTYIIERDSNRAEDGKGLRKRWAESVGNPSLAKYMRREACSVLEMMVALAVRCEEAIMDDPTFGDRTAHWFWQMVVSLGLGSERNDVYDEERVDTILDKFLEREYEPNGKGGLFLVRGCDTDMRQLEIWYQMCSYLDTII